ncbi:MerR family transcriptional regulator [Sphaerisporangium melleum]|uniref:MerR family transcriptional regulator n=1 Tax=Sphaerisporangium melleum TaxID=321316 RepID=A0A917VV12_9ACTN|nr:MerR family transcriptional regulator [Sphaerisporangium melleum]GGL21068.1 MerR family transcriptional regulator [Sphaerisporangium melleum]GII74976.1 MerR family transcriptional regulator [Sphaerisporangium melleum]
MSVYTPGQVAEETGFSIDTLRYYERIGLLERVERNSAGQRRFSEEDVGWLGMVRCLRDTGMPIAEMLRFAALVRDGEETIGDRITLLEAHDQEVEEQIALLRERQTAIRRKIQYYRDVLALRAEVDSDPPLPEPASHKTSEEHASH